MKFTSRERYESLKKCVKSYYDMANNTADMLWIFTIDFDDETYNNEDFVTFLDDLKINYSIFIGSSKGKIDAINRDVKSVTENWDILLNISDDQLPIYKGYDDIIRETMPESLDFSLWFTDKHQSLIITQEILGRKYYENQGYIYYPEYKSFFCDNESTIVAQKLNKLIKSDLCIIEHFHPAWNSEIENDVLYQKNNIHWDYDKDLFLKRNADAAL